MEVATVVDSDSEIATGDSALLGEKCAEVSAAWTLAAELKIEQPDLTFVSIVDKTWPDKSLGCANVGSDTGQEIPGFEVVFSYLNTSHVAVSYTHLTLPTIYSV